MNNYDILMAFSGVDDDLLRRSGERSRPHKIIARWAAVAASFALVIAVGFGLWAAFSHVRQPSGLLFNTIIERGSSEPSMKEDAFYEEMTEDELAAALPVYQSDLLSSATGTVEYLAQSGELSELWMRVFLQSWDRQINVRVSPNKLGMNLGCIAPANEKIRSSHLGSLTYTAYRFDWGEDIELWVDFQIGNAYYRMSAYVVDNEEAAVRALYELLASYEGRLREGVTLDLSAFHMREEHE